MIIQIITNLGKGEIEVDAPNEIVSLALRQLPVLLYNAYVVLDVEGDEEKGIEAMPMHYVVTTDWDIPVEETAELIAYNVKCTSENPDCNPVAEAVNKLLESVLENKNTENVQIKWCNHDIAAWVDIPKETIDEVMDDLKGIPNTLQCEYDEDGDFIIDLTGACDYQVIDYVEEMDKGFGVNEENIRLTIAEMCTLAEKNVTKYDVVLKYNDHPLFHFLDTNGKVVDYFEQEVRKSGHKDRDWETFQLWST